MLGTALAALEGRGDVRAEPAIVSSAPQGQRLPRETPAPSPGRPPAGGRVAGVPGGNRQQQSQILTTVEARRCP